MKILIVEDDRYFALRVSEMLTDNGIESTICKDTQSALECNLEEFSAAIIDVMLPNDPEASGISSEESRGGYMSGIALARKFKSRLPDLHVILLSSDVGISEARQWATENNVRYISKLEPRARLISVLGDLKLIEIVDRPRSFIVHGHDESLLLEMKDYIQNVLNWPQPIILRDQPSCGKTIIEKFEDSAGIIDWVFVLLSPDDEIFNPVSNDDRRRARQNVIFELGFFYGLIGRCEGRVIALRKGDVEIPSDIHGVIWIDASEGIRAAGEDIRREVGM